LTALAARQTVPPLTGLPTEVYRASSQMLGSGSSLLPPIIPPQQEQSEDGGG